MIWRNLLRRRVRTLLTVLGISVGLGLIVALVAIADGFVESFGSMASRSGSDLTVMQADVADMSFSVLDEDVGRKIAAIPGVSQVAGTIFTAVPMPGTPYFLVFGYDPQQYAFRHFKIVEGQSRSASATASRSTTPPIAWSPFSRRGFPSRMGPESSASRKRSGSSPSRTGWACTASSWTSRRTRTACAS
jgi:hypothetical protein